jgi:hypothetical protein
MDSRRSKIVKKEVEFEQVEDFITEEMVTDGYLKSEAMSLGKRLMVSLFFAGSVQVVYWFGYFLITNSPFSEASKEYQFFIHLKWLALLFCSYYVFCMLFLGGRYRRRDNIKLAYKSNCWLVQLSIVFYVFLMIDLQLLTQNSYLKLINAVLFLGCCGYSVIRYQEKKAYLIEQQPPTSKISQWLSEKRFTLKLILATYLIGAALIQIYSGIFSQFGTGKLEGFIILATAPALSALVSILGIFFFSWLFESMIKIKFLYQFSEQFRQKFAVDEKLWYGSKYNKN